MEWTNDWALTYTADAQTNPSGPINGTTKIIRGGAYDSYLGSNLSHRSAYRLDYKPNIWYDNTGFRVVYPAQ